MISVTMAFHAFENLDEFFDFDQLVTDHGAQAANPPLGQHYDTFDHPEDVMAIDWPASEVAPQFALDAQLSQENQLLDRFEEYQVHDQVEWSPAGIPFHFPEGQSTRVDSYPEFEGHAAATENIAHVEQLFLPIAPSSSLRGNGDDLDAGSARGDGETDSPENFELALATASPFDLPTAVATTHPGTDINVPSRPRPDAPLRQSSTSSRKPASAKRKGPQSRISLEARQILEDEFAANPYPCSWELDIIAHQANLDVKKVRNWFNNTRARKKDDGESSLMEMDVASILTTTDGKSTHQATSDGIGRSLATKLSKDSLEALDEALEDDVSQPPQPLAVYLAQSYQEEAITYPAVQAAIDSSSLCGNGDYDDAWSASRQGRRGSVITSAASSEVTAPTTYTVSSSGSRSNVSSFGRDRRRGRRRMAWKESPYNDRPKFNGVNSAGEPQKDLPFFCTFCPRAFKTKYEWVRHEDSVHALRTTWICCDTKNTSIESCPFCGQMHPDDAHMAGHKYQQCRSKPESQRTFYRRDHFVQHIHHVHFTNTKHPSVRVGCQTRLMNTEGQNFGCKDLALKWRRFGAPMKRDDPMLHCGMCGKITKDWAERSIHVAEHLIAREHDRSVWWPERKENHLENLYSKSPFESFRCRYCLKIFKDVAEMNAHSHCKVWSCRFLKSFDELTADNAGPPLCPDFPSTKAHHCHLCGAGYRTPHAEHAQSFHRYRSCNQEFYTSEEAFLQHLHISHAASHPIQLQGNSVIEQNFMRNKGASFEPIEFNESWQPCLMDLDTAPIGPFMVDNTATPLSIKEKNDHAPTRKQSVARKKTREEHIQATMGAGKVQQRQRSDTTASRLEMGSPRFLRLSTYAPFLSSRVFYSRESKLSGIPRDNEAVIEEMPRPHIAALVMSAGLVSLASVRWAIRPKQHAASGMIELLLDEDE
jgi:hypothetical protein